jgi:hypothetical protein
MRVVVLGASGNFGARIVRSLQADPALELLAASRQGTVVTGAPDIATVQLDLHAADFATRLAALQPQLLIHCAGAFQGQDYRAVRAALAAGSHYLDLADGRDFVAGFARENDAAARIARRFACSGASTLPALSSAVIDSLQTEFGAMQAVHVAIAPGQRAPRGAATLAAVFSYLGMPFLLLENGEWRRARGWMELRRLRLAFGTRWAALCDVPDLALLPQRHPSLRTVTFRAALEHGAQHFMLWTLAAARALGVPVPMRATTRLLARCAGRFDRWGGEWGGMQVSIEGVALDGTPRRRVWQLRAPALHGPEIPCMAAVLLARRLARGEALPSGAHACMGFLRLEEFEAEFARWGIVTHVERQELPA